MVDYEKFQKSLKLLEEQNTRLNEIVDDQPDWVIDAVKESTIQRFETCWDCLWKVLRRYLEEESGLPNPPNGPNPVLRLANENNLLPSPIEEWFTFAKARVGTSHDYSGEKSEQALEIMSDFISAAIALYQLLSGKRWEQ